MVSADYARTPVKPAVNGEPNYETHPVNWNQRNGWFDDYDVRKAAFTALFAGAFGHTYGTWSDWQVQRPFVADNLPGLAQMQHVRSLMESRPMLTRIPDRSLVTGEGDVEVPVPVPATRDSGGRYAMVYVARPHCEVTIDTDKLAGISLDAWWYDPRTGALCDSRGEVTGEPFGSLSRGGRATLKSPSVPVPPMGGSDWVLVIDDSSAGFAPPGTRRA